MKQIHWDLEDILTLNDFEPKLLEAQNGIETFAKKLGVLSADMPLQIFQGLISSYEDLTDKLMRLYARAMLWEEVEQKNSEPKFMKSKVNNLLIAFDEQTRIFWLWIKGKKVDGLDVLNDVAAKRFFDSVPKLSYLLEREHSLAIHTLNNEAESIITNKDVFGLSTLLDLRAQLDSDITYHLTINGKRRVIKNTSELMQLVQAKNPATREAAYRALFKHYKANEHKYFSIYEAVVKNWNYEVKLRKYLSAINMRNVSNDVPDAVVETLLKVCEQNAQIFQRFFKLKAKILQVQKLRRFDLYAPIPNVKDERKYTYRESLEIVSEVLGAFDSDFLKHMETIVNQDHIDVFPNKQKSGGAFCMTVSNKLAPYVMLNHLGSKRDVMTMAHELGHGVHSMFSSRQSILAQEAPLPLAETASTFSENLVFENMYAKLTDKNEKIEMLFGKLSDSYATIMRQNFFVMFELEAHKLIPAGIRIDDLHNRYLENLKLQFDDSVEVDPVFKYEWLYIPHIVNSPFYCYAYSFGELLALSLYENYKIMGKDYIRKIKHILAAGCSVNAVKLLGDQGIDITKASFWQASFDYINDMIDELEKFMS